MNRIFGHDAVSDKIAHALAQAKLHHGLIFAGPRGVGKASSARSIAGDIVDPIGAHTALLASGNFPDILTVSRLPREAPKPGEAAAPDAELKRSIGVDQIRQLQSVLTKRPAISDKRVVIIDAADDMELGASNALLKSLEEPPAGCHFILISHASDRLLPTIRSRCQIFRFDSLGAPDMTAALQVLLPDHDASEIEMLRQLGRGSPGIALEFAGLKMGELEQKMQQIIRSGDADNAIRSLLAGQLSVKAAQPRYEAFLRRVPSVIADAARSMPADANITAIDAWKKATELAARAIGVSLDKNAVILEMGSLLASLNQHKHASR